MNSLILIAIVIVIALASYAAFLWQKVFKQQAEKKAQEDAYQQSQEKKLAHIHESLIVIAKALKDNQCPPIEGCIRIKVLLDQLQLPPNLKQEFNVFESVFEKTQHIPTHENWKNLKLKQRHKFALEMEAIEKECFEAINRATDSLLAHFDVKKASVH